MRILVVLFIGYFWWSQDIIDDVRDGQALYIPGVMTPSEVCFYPFDITPFSEAIQHLFLPAWMENK